MYSCHFIYDTTPYGTTLAHAGRPPPNIQWLIDDMPVDSKLMQLPGDVVKSSLLVPNLTRQHLHSVLECQASNSNTSLPLSTTVTLDMNCELKKIFCLFICCFVTVNCRAKSFCLENKIFLDCSFYFKFIKCNYI